MIVWAIVMFTAMQFAWINGYFHTYKAAISAGAIKRREAILLIPSTLPLLVAILGIAVSWELAVRLDLSPYPTIWMPVWSMLVWWPSTKLAERKFAKLCDMPAR